MKSQFILYTPKKSIPHLFLAGSYLLTDCSKCGKTLVYHHWNIKGKGWHATWGRNQNCSCSNTCLHRCVGKKERTHFSENLLIVGEKNSNDGSWAVNLCDQGPTFCRLWVCCSRSIDECDQCVYERISLILPKSIQRCEKSFVPLTKTFAVSVSSLWQLSKLRAVNQIANNCKWLHNIIHMKTN